MSITFRKLTEPAELQMLAALEGAVWNTKEVIPYHMTITVAKFGGLFLGAFDQDQMIGFLYSFPGYTHAEPHLCSHMLGFLPAYRKQGLGMQMKWRQREEALTLGYKKITWTYDPLETVNGILNIVKLGGIVRTYLPDCYGELNDEFNQGLPTDRFLVEWFLESGRVNCRHPGPAPSPKQLEHAPEALHYELVEGVPRPLSTQLNLESPVLLVPVPAHFQEVKKADMDTARAWRQMTRDIFQTYLERGYTVTHLVRDQDIVRYVLDKQPLTAILGDSARS
ncbi:GNAT family N-acetyltransferase [Brevibacillus sp. GCM10020057]|uniref:GNAT family N-acetyltransferase n=1 Tax=Brevibacillus sp. GCM10020057 TaxID=3317327 RepID=UPI00363AF7CB